MKNLKKLGKILGKKEQKEVFGGTIPYGITGGGEHGYYTFGESEGFQCDSDMECPNAVDHFSGNYCQGYCFMYATGSRCAVYVC